MLEIFVETYLTILIKMGCILFLIYFGTEIVSVKEKKYTTLSYTILHFVGLFISILILLSWKGVN